MVRGGRVGTGIRKGCFRLRAFTVGYGRSLASERAFTVGFVRYSSIFSVCGRLVSRFGRIFLRWDCAGSGWIVDIFLRSREVWRLSRTGVV